MVTIFIKPQRGTTIRLKVLLGDIVEKVKAMIDDKADIPPDQQRLKYTGMLLNDAQTLSDCNIHNESTLHLVRLPA